MSDRGITQSRGRRSWPSLRVTQGDEPPESEPEDHDLVHIGGRRHAGVEV